MLCKIAQKASILLQKSIKGKLCDLIKMMIAY